MDRGARTAAAILLRLQPEDRLKLQIAGGRLERQKLGEDAEGPFGIGRSINRHALNAEIKPHGAETTDGRPLDDGENMSVVAPFPGIKQIDFGFLVADEPAEKIVNREGRSCSNFHNAVSYRMDVPNRFSGQCSHIDFQCIGAGRRI